MLWKPAFGFEYHILLNEKCVRLWCYYCCCHSRRCVFIVSFYTHLSLSSSVVFVDDVVVVAVVSP